jgi:hypothetical protein
MAPPGVTVRRAVPEDAIAHSAVPPWRVSAGRPAAAGALRRDGEYVDDLVMALLW